MQRRAKRETKIIEGDLGAGILMIYLPENRSPVVRSGDGRALSLGWQRVERGEEAREKKNGILRIEP
jgi:hypothetical protein